MISIKKQAFLSVSILFSSSITFCADSQAGTELIQVTSTSYPFNGKQQSVKLKKDTLIKMPYVRALLQQPQDYDNPMTYSKNRLYLDFKSPQEENIFLLLYTLLQRIQPEDTMYDILQQIQQHYPHSIKNINETLAIAHKYLSITSALNTLRELNAQPLIKELGATKEQIHKDFFTPDTKIELLILSVIRAEKKSIKIACYKFNNEHIVEELHKAHKRGVKVEVIVDKTNNSDDIIQLFKLYKIPYYEWNDPERSKAIMHAKFMLCEQNILDQSLILSGSYNFTHAAELWNTEHMSVYNNKASYNKFKDQFQHLKQQSRPVVKGIEDEKHLAALAQDYEHQLVEKYTPEAYNILKAFKLEKELQDIVRYAQEIKAARTLGSKRSSDNRSPNEQNLHKRSRS
ncbi:MAG: phospholipase D-like domain-containing protein [Candidatus Dependentiae bacterium]